MIRLLLCAASAVLFASSACAQQVGTYVGTTKDGSAMSVVVGTDPDNGKFTVKGVSFEAQAACRKSQEMLGGFAVGFFDQQDIDHGRFAYILADAQSYIAFNMDFHGTASVRGKVSALYPAFDPFAVAGEPPTKLQFCVLAAESFTATFSGADAKLPVPPGTLKIGNSERALR